tara:strand:- start:77 stop:2455 length:2379 start_codon:yes stop_codon:yes gene_type:complete
MDDMDETTLELLAALEDAAPNARKLKQELQGVSSVALEAAKAQAAHNAAIENALKEELARRIDVIQKLKDANDLAERRFKIEKDSAKQYEKAVELNETKVKQLEQELQYLERGSTEYNKIKESITKIKGDTEDIVNSQKEFEKQLQKSKQVADEIGSTIKGITSSLSTIAKGDFASGFKQLGSSLMEPLKKIAGKGFEKAKDNLMDSFSKMGQKLPELAAGATEGAAGLGAVGPAAMSAGAAIGALGAALFVVLPLLIALAVAIGVTVKIAQFALELENSARQLTKVTGLSKDFSSAMLENADSLREFGASSEDINAAVISLNATFTDFSMLNMDSAAKVKDTTVVLGKLGMSADDAAKGFQALTKGMGQTPKQAADTMLELDAVARDLGVSTSKMGADFASASSQLQKLSGPEQIRAFKQLAVVSKATGIEVSRLLAITEKFDTFEGAATAAGKLNAALGGNFVNAMELVTATNPVERFEMIRDSILDSGLAFDEMSYYQKKFFAEAAGMQDVGELALAMSGDFGAVGAEIGKTQADYEAASERAKEFQSVQEQLKNTMQSLIPVVKPLIKFIGETTLAFSEFVSEYKDEIQGVFKGLMYLVGGLAVSFVLMNLPLMLTIAAIAAIATGIGYVLSLLGDFAAGLFGVRKSLSVDHNSPTLLGGLEEMASSLGGIGDASGAAMGSVDKLKGKMSGFRKELFSGDNNLVAGMKMTTESVEGVGDASAKAAATSRATAPTIANNTAIKNTTINNSTQGSGATGINIKFDNKKFADLFDIQVEKSIGRAARKAVI